MKVLTIVFIIFHTILIIAQNSPDTISVIAVGDIMLGTDYPRDRLPVEDGRFLLKDVYDILSSADITIGNYEGVLLDGGVPRKKCKDTTKCYLFRTPTRFVKNLSKAGFDFVSMSNNHANDFGDVGIKSTINTLRSAGMKVSGPVGVVASDTLKESIVSFIAFSTSPGMYSLLNIKKAQSEVEELKKISDIVIISFHGGAEGEEALHVVDEMEIAYGEKRGKVIEFSHAMIDAGADLVIGHGPHVPRALELYKDRLIAYSLGNFCTYEGFSLQGAKGIAPILYLKISGKGKMISAEIISAIQQRPYGPLLDVDNRAYKLIRKLTHSDFPENDLEFVNNRKIILRNLEY